MDNHLLMTYHVSGTLEKECPWGGSERDSIYQEIEAESEQDAIDKIEREAGASWSFLNQPTTWRVTEAMKLERAGELSLFPLWPKG